MWYNNSFSLSDSSKNSVLIGNNITILQMRKWRLREVKRLTSKVPQLGTAKLSFHPRSVGAQSPNYIPLYRTGTHKQNLNRQNKSCLFPNLQFWSHKKYGCQSYRYNCLGCSPPTPQTQSDLVCKQLKTTNWYLLKDLLKQAFSRTGSTKLGLRAACFHKPFYWNAAVPARSGILWLLSYHSSRAEGLR